MLQKMDELEGKEMTFAGIITDVQHRVAKNGKPWGIFTFEDYSDAYEFKLFNEDYLKFRHYLIQNTFLYLKTAVRRPWQNGDLRVYILAIQQLQDILGNMAKKISINLDIKKINKKEIDHIENVIKKHKGNQNLHFVIYDVDEKIQLTMPSRTTKIAISNELIEELTNNEFNFKLN